MSRDIPLWEIDADPAQPRKHFDTTELEELAQSMAANGMIVPILIRPMGDRFIIVHGERRYRAAKWLGWEYLPAEVRDITPDEAQWFALVENIQRRDLSPIEEARAYRAVLDTGITQTALAQRIGKTQSYIATKLRFLQLEPELATALEDGSLTEGHAKQLLRLENSASRREIYTDICRDHLSVKQTSVVVDRLLRPMTNADRTELARHEAAIDEALAHLTVAGLGIQKNIKALHSGLAPEQFRQWALTELHMDEATALDWLKYDGTMNSMTDRMWAMFRLPA